MQIAKFVPNAVSRKVGRAILQTRLNSPTILFVGGVVGVVATTILASHATLKVEAVLEDSKAKLAEIKEVCEDETTSYDEESYAHDRVYIYARTAVSITKLYTPAFVVGVASIACLTQSHHLLTKRNAALTAAYAALEKGFAEYRSRVVEQFGSEQDLKFRHGSREVEILEETAHGPVVVRETRVGPDQPSVYARFFDESCGERWSTNPEYNRIFLNARQNYFNNMLQARGHLFLNEVYDALGLPRTSAGSVVGWIYGEGDSFVDLGIFDGSNERMRAFVNGHEGAVLIDPNVDGIIWEKIGSGRW